MSEFKEYVKIQKQLMRPYVQGEILSDRVSISKFDRENGSPKLGDMIACNPEDHSDQWLIAKDFFNVNYKLA